MLKAQPQSTLIAARILGPLLLAAGIAFIAQNGRMMRVVNAFIEEDALAVVAAFIALIFGLVIITLHDHWRGFTQIVISVVGWLSLLRGALLLFAPDLMREAAMHFVTTPWLAPIVGLVAALFGLWLTFIGFIGRPEENLELGHVR